MSKTLAELEAENAELRARVALHEKTLARLLAEPPKVEVRVEKQKEYVYVPYPTSYAVPYVPSPAPQPWDTTWPWWQVNPPGWPYDQTVTCMPYVYGQTTLFQNNAGCAGNLPFHVQHYDGQGLVVGNLNAGAAGWPMQNWTTFTIGGNGPWGGGSLS